MGKSIKLVVIDDELTARSMVKNLLKESSLYDVVADFGESAQALEWFEEHQADIVLMDMNMPKISGVELINIICADNSDVHFIAISGYEDFEYVRGCLKNDRVGDYLLKHQLTKEGLLRALDDMQRRYMIQPHQENQQKDALVEELFRNPELTEQQIREMTKEAQIHFQFTDLVMLYLSLDAKFYLDGTEGQATDNLTAVLQDIVKETIVGKHEYLMYKPDEKNLVVIISFTNIKSYQYILNTQTVMIRRIQKMVERLLNMTVTIWTGKIQSQIVNSLKEFRRIQEMENSKLYRKPGSVVMYGLIDDEAVDSGVYLMGETDENNLRYLLSLRKEEKVYVQLKAIFEHMTQHRCNQRDVQLICKKILSIASEECGEEYLPQEQMDRALRVMKRLDFIEQYQEYTWELLKQALKKKQGTFEQQYEPAIARTIDYINQHFAKDITLEECAGHVGISYAYLSRSFKKALGIRFKEYLNQVRINKAKNLIEQGELSIKEIATECGFSNYTYFFKVFKEVAGVPPNQYHR